jgi:hypothetical protein
MLASFRQRAGVLLFDVPRTWAALRRPEGWVQVTNRLDSVSRSSEPFGIRCHSDSTSSLHLCDVFPLWGRWLLRSVLRTWEFRLAESVRFSAEPIYSFVIPYRGIGRQSQLEATIRSIAALAERVECIVVEQDERSCVENLPGNTRYVHAPHPSENENWHKCFAFNCGVRKARGQIVICHDADILVPTRYLEVIHHHLIRGGQEVVYPQRFLFYLDQETTSAILRTNDLSGLESAVPDAVKQNWTGGTLAITKQAYWKIGGFDERFTNWAGEDREFYDRCQVLDGWFFGYVPFLHLWHEPQAGRTSSAQRQQAWDFTRKRLAVPRQVRIQELTCGADSGGPRACQAENQETPSEHPGSVTVRAVNP